MTDPTLSDVLNENQRLYKTVQELTARLAKYSVHGSDGCKNCETGRITVYAKSRWCLECLKVKK
jgi:hypothetical protein